MIQKQFADIIQLIKQSQGKAIKAVNTELINLYWNVGAYITKRVANADWGEKTIQQLADFIQLHIPLKADTHSGNKRTLFSKKYLV